MSHPWTVPEPQSAPCGGESAGGPLGLSAPTLPSPPKQAFLGAHPLSLSPSLSSLSFCLSVSLSLSLCLPLSLFVSLSLSPHLSLPYFSLSVSLSLSPSLSVSPCLWFSPSVSITLASLWRTGHAQRGPFDS